MIGFEFFQKIYAPEAELMIFDVGAHYGESVSEFITLFPRSRVFAFEPDEKNWSRLQRRFANKPSIDVYHLAVGQKDGRAVLHRNNYDATHSLLRFNAVEINRWADANDFSEDRAEEVDELTLDTFCARHGIANIDILKLDIQGGELMALQGVKDKLANQAVGGIFCEVEFRELYEGQPLFWDITAFLMSHSYHFLNIVSPKISEMGVLSWADAIYVNDHLWQDIGSKHSAGKLIS
jgi:FkbM family methyltransferase